jgi:PleD family two-component response regulator
MRPAMPFAPQSTSGGAESLHASRILLVQGSAGGLARIESLLCEAGFTNLVSTIDSRLALTSFLEVKPDLVVLDLALSPIDCFGVMDQLRTALPENEFLPIMILAGSAGEETKQARTRRRRADILVEPFARQEAILRIEQSPQDEAGARCIGAAAGGARMGIEQAHHRAGEDAR